jgi:hypothetical protein
MSTFLTLLDYQIIQSLMGVVNWGGGDQDEGQAKIFNPI